MKRIKFLKSQFRAIQTESRRLSRSGGREVYGLILDNGYFYELIEVRNKIQRGGGFAFYFNDVRAISKMAGLFKHNIVGTFHSHPVGFAEPGASDLNNAVDNSMMFIFDVIGRSGKLWNIKNHATTKRSFILI